MLKYFTSAAIILANTVQAAESFESIKLGALAPETPIAYGSLLAETSHAAISTKARNGDKALHILGGEKRQLEIALTSPLKQEGVCQFWAERWSRKGPFEVNISARMADGSLKLIETGKKISVGGYNTEIVKTIPVGATAIVIESTTPDGTGLLIDDLVIHAGPMTVKGIELVNPGEYPIFKRAEVNAAACVLVETEGVTGKSLNELKFKISPASAVASVQLRRGNQKGYTFESDKGSFATVKPSADGTVTLKGPINLKAGDNYFWIDVTPSAAAKVGSEISISQVSVSAGKKVQRFATTISQEVGYLLARVGEQVKQLDGSMRKCGHFRIPGMVMSRKGTLVAVFDARYNHGGDLCADIDVAAVRSTDNGQTWTLPEIVMDTGVGASNGCGDPCILEDAGGRIWVQALTTHFGGGASLFVSTTGQDPKTTAQWNMTYSSDDGKTWIRDLVNPTKQVKKDEWNCILAGPGSGITLKDGTIVFPAQIWQTGAPIRCMATICYSKDGGKNWAFGEGVPHATSESQVVELADGSVMINSRNEARSGYRVVYTTKDLGKSWQPHESNLKALREPTCRASLIAIKSKTHGNMLLFSNPKSGSRNTMTIRYSKDEGKTWSEGYLYDSRNGAGYSSLAMIDDETIAVVYESTETHSLKGGKLSMSFLIIPLKDILKAK